MLKAEVNSGDFQPVPNQFREPSSQGNNDNMKRRAVACKSCHSLKVKCTPLDPKDPSGECVRCSKAGRPCEIDLSQPRRRKRKTSVSVRDAKPLSAKKQAQQLQQAQPAQLPQQERIPASASVLQRQPSSVTSDDDSDISHVERLENKVKQLEEELSRQQHRNSFLEAPKVQGYANGSTVHTQQPHLSAYASSYSSPGTTTANSSYQAPAPQFSMQNSVPPFQQSIHQQPPAPQFQGNSPSFHPVPSHNASRSPYPVSLPPLQKTMASPYMESPQNIEVSPEEVKGNDRQIQELQTELNSLMSTQRATLSQLTSEVLKVADRRTELIQAQDNATTFDCIAQGYITLEEADERLRLYRERIYPMYPFIEIPQDITADEMRVYHKFLFNTIITVTAQLIPKDSPSLRYQMEIELCNIRQITSEVLIIGNKTLEILKCLVLLSVWYNSAELFHQRRYHLINSLCISMVHDLGLTGRAYFFYNKEERSVKRTEASENPKGLEFRRILLTVYFTSISISLFLRRRFQVNWTSYLQECCEVLEATHDSGDLKIALLSRLNRILERIHFIVHGNQEPTDSAFMQPDRLKYIVLEIQKDLSEIKCKIDKEDHCLLSFYYSVQAYLHEPSLHRLFVGQSKTVVSPTVISSIDKCSRSCIAALEQANMVTLDDMTAMPLLYASRVIYTSGMLLRLRYLVISIPSLRTSTYFPSDSIEKIQQLATTVYEASSKYPSNNFLYKMRLVIALFSQTYSTQLQKLITDKLQSSPQAIKWDRDGDIASLHILSQAAAAARSGTMDLQTPAPPTYHYSEQEKSRSPVHQSQPPPSAPPPPPPPSQFDTANLGNGNSATGSFNNTFNVNTTDTNTAINGDNNNNNTNAAMGNTVNGNGTGNSDLEFSYYALNDEFWSDLLMNDDKDPLGDVAGLGDIDQFSEII